MRATKMTKLILIARFLLAPTVALLLTVTAHGATPGITGPTFNLMAQTAFLNQPDGAAVYAWGYGCNGTPTGFAPAAITGATCPSMQVPGPTLIVTEGQTVTVTLTNNLPAAAGNTSILFPGFQVTSTGGVPGLLTQEAAPGGSVTYTFTATASTPGTHAYYSGTQGDLQIEMGLYGAVIVIPATIPSNCTTGLAADKQTAKTDWKEPDFRLAPAAYNNAEACYDREYLFQWSEMDPSIHRAALAQVTGCIAGGNPGCSLQVPTEPYHPAYFLINGRSMPDLMDANYASEYPHQPYNANPHMHPGDLTLVRAIGQGRWQHPFHEHGNHVRILGRDGNLIVSQTAGSDPSQTSLAGLLMFNTDTTPGQAFEGIFYWTGRGLNWDPYGHNPKSTDANATLPCYPDANGYNTGYDPITGLSTHPEVIGKINYYEWCQDHNKPLEVAPFGDIAGGGPATLPDPNIFTNGPWYGGTPYLGPDATTRSAGPTDNLQPSNIQANPANERGFAYMWHSHNEREITTNNVFPGGMLMMMLVDSREFVINESN
jgi:FtsP/CotA-like multicopper oxidase with cupredoxin domain